jgi:hypothetical protein
MQVYGENTTPEDELDEYTEQKISIHVRILFNFANESIRSLTYNMEISSDAHIENAASKKYQPITQPLELTIESVIVQQLYDFKYPFIVTTLGRKYVIVYALTRPNKPFCIEFNRTHY